MGMRRRRTLLRDHRLGRGGHGLRPRGRRRRGTGLRLHGSMRRVRPRGELLGPVGALRAKDLRLQRGYGGMHGGRQRNGRNAVRCRCLLQRGCLQRVQGDGALPSGGQSMSRGRSHRLHGRRADVYGPVDSSDARRLVHRIERCPRGLRRQRYLRGVHAERRVQSERQPLPERRSVVFLRTGVRQREQRARGPAVRRRSDLP